MTIQGLYLQNGLRGGFWVQHRSWRNMCAQVRKIEGQQDDALSSECARDTAGTDLIVQCFDVRSGRALPAEHCLENPEDRNFTLIAEPAWSHSRGLTGREHVGSKAMAR
ncbi:MAG TPA: hypothetical protein VF669_16030 [Tepidisphaeraceae bacterium]|jgi:hypothetical protein